MKKNLLLTLAVTFMAVFAIAQTQVLSDTGLESSGAGGTEWTSTSTTFGTVLCDGASCGNCGGPCGPNGGAWYAWFGGTSAAETGTLSQSFNVATAGTGYLNFFWKVPMKGTTADSLVITINGALVFAEATDDSIGAYTEVLINLGNLPAGNHTLLFTAVKTSAATVNVLVDDITLSVGNNAGMSEIDFSNGITLFSNNELSSINISMNLMKETDLRISISDMMGRTVYNNLTPNAQYNNLVIPTESWSTGVYNVIFTDASGYSFTKKVFVK
jgi:hypothetical protein